MPTEDSEHPEMLASDLSDAESTQDEEEMEEEEEEEEVGESEVTEGEEEVEEEDAETDYLDVRALNQCSHTHRERAGGRSLSLTHTLTQSLTLLNTHREREMRVRR